VGKNLRVSFTLPRLATDGERLTKPQELEILRDVHPPNESLPAAASQWELWQTLADEDIQKHLQGDAIALTLPLSGKEPFSSRMQFAVRTLTRGFRDQPRTSTLSNVVTLSLLQAPDAIQGLRATATEGAIDVSWTVPDQPITAYRLQRSGPGAAGSFREIAELPDPPYRDADFQFGRSYRYKVIALVKGQGSVAESEESAAIEITPRDTFPPKPPEGLTAVNTTDAIELIWNVSPEADLLGYNVYRQEDNSTASKLNPEPLSTPIYRDSKIAAGKTYKYRVTALDIAGNESGPSTEAEAEVR